MIISDNAKYKKKKHPSNYFHLALGMHQIGFIVMLLPTNKESTCTEVIPKTHNSSRIGIEFYKQRETKEFIDYAKNMAKKFGSKKLFGDIGTTYIFDAGNMLHRGSSGTDRAMLQINFTSSLTNKQGTTNKDLSLNNAIGKKPSKAFNFEIQ